MTVMRFAQPIVPDALRRILGPLEGPQHGAVPGMALVGPVDLTQHLLQVAAKGQVTGLEPGHLQRLFQLRQLLRVRLLMDPMDQQAPALGQFAAHRFIRRQHAFLDQLMGLVRR